MLKGVPLLTLSLTIFSSPISPSHSFCLPTPPPNSLSLSLSHSLPLALTLSAAKTLCHNILKLIGLRANHVYLVVGVPSLLKLANILLSKWWRYDNVVVVDGDMRLQLTNIVCWANGGSTIVISRFAKKQHFGSLVALNDQKSSRMVLALILRYLFANTIILIRKGESNTNNSTRREMCVGDK